MSSEHSNRDADLPSGWERVPLREIAEINPGLEIRIEDDGDHVNFVPMRAVEPEGAGLLRPEVRAYGEVKKGYTVFRSGDVIMAKITPCMENGKTTVVPELPDSICFGSTEFHVIRTETGVDPRWISNFLLQHEVRRTAQRSMTGGVGQMRVPGSFVSGVEIPLPPRDEVQRIFAELDELFPDLDGAVSALKSVQKKLPLYRASLLKAAVEGNLTSEWRERHRKGEHASELLKRILIERRRQWEKEQLQNFEAAGKEPPTNWKDKYKEPNEPNIAILPPLPTGWCWANAEQLCSFITKGTTPSGDNKAQAHGEIPFIKVQHLSSTGTFHFLESPEFVSKNTHYGFLRRSRVFPGDVLMNIVGPPLGQVSIVPADFPEWNTNQAIAIFRVIRGVSNRYLSLCLREQNILRRALRQAKTTAGQVNLTLEICRQLPIPLAPENEQDAIIEDAEGQVSLIDHSENALENKLSIVDALRQSILKHAFAGKLLPQNPNDEPASELLKRIAAEREERARVAKAAKRGVKMLSRNRDAANL